MFFCGCYALFRDYLREKRIKLLLDGCSSCDITECGLRG